MSKLFCFIGPSGSGKSTLQHSLPPWVKFLTNYTTRPLRDGEVEGYHIMQVSREDFIFKETWGTIATKTEYAGNLYGAPSDSIWQIIRGTPHHATATIDHIRQFKVLLGEENVVTIYIKPPSIEVLRERMADRGDRPEDIDRRISYIYSAAELENEKIAEYVIVNDDLLSAKIKTLGIIYKELYLKKEELL
jgi:guanylate kinase